MGSRDEVDVVIVGSGAGGGTLAAALCEAGITVELLEKGPHYGLLDFTHDELTICRRNFFVPYVSDEPHLVRQSTSEPFQKSNDGWIACCVGGGTVHMSGFLYRLHREDFELQTRHGAIPGATIADWPIGYDDLAPWYDRAEVAIGVSGRAGENPFDEPRTTGYPLPALLHHPLADHLNATAKRLGLHPFPTPRSVLSAPYDGRPPCNYCGLCGEYGCENGSKSDVLSTFIRRALATGRCRLRPNAMVREITVDGQGRARGVVCQDAHGNRREVRARVVAVACSAIETARLLLLSRSGKFPQGLANSSGLVGKHLGFSTLSRVEADFARTGGGRAVAGFDDPLPWLGVSIQDYYRLPATAGSAGGAKGGTLRFDFMHPSVISRAERVARSEEPPLWGQALKDRLRRHFRECKTVETEIFGEFLPLEGTYVDLDPKITDRYGLPVARITLQHHPVDVAAIQFLTARARDVLQAMGADSLRVDIPLGTLRVLQRGTCRFGTDPSRSVLDPSCRAHDVPNLYVVDGSFMPTGGGVPTTLTIQANALRVGAIVVERMRRREHG
jgi:choline dehydrogenase-like flavoprotein